MASPAAFDPGGYRFVAGVFQYSAGVAAQPGFEIVRARLARTLPLAEGFAAVEAHLQSVGRPLAAICACDLRSPAPFSERGFADFNRQYVETLARWGVYRDGVNPVARTNVCPAHQPPLEPSLYAFSYTVPAPRADRASFVVSGSGEAREGGKTYSESIVRLGDVSPEGLRDKVRFVVAEMEWRIRALGFGWTDARITQAYTVHDIGALVGPEIAQRGACPHGLTWHLCRPPVADIEFEMDVLAPAVEIRI